jgi:hypothetical protein
MAITPSAHRRRANDRRCGKAPIRDATVTMVRKILPLCVRLVNLFRIPRPDRLPVPGLTRGPSRPAMGLEASCPLGFGGTVHAPFAFAKGLAWRLLYTRAATEGGKPITRDLIEGSRLADKGNAGSDEKKGTENLDDHRTTCPSMVWRERDR